MEICGDTKILFDTQRKTHVIAAFTQGQWKIGCVANGASCRSEWPEFYFPRNFDLRELQYHTLTGSIYAVGNEVSCWCTVWEKVRYMQQVYLGSTKIDYSLSKRDII